jgi:rRNA maturation endonuclease Nob1
MIKMASATFIRAKQRMLCHACESLIEQEQPYYSCEINSMDLDLCEDCGNDLQNDMADGYQKFVDLNM